MRQKNIKWIEINANNNTELILGKQLSQKWMEPMFAKMIPNTPLTEINKPIHLRYQA